MASYKRKEPNLYAAESAMAFISGNTAMPLYDMDSFQKMRIIKGGVSKSYLEKLKKTTNLDYDSLATALSVTRATLINKKGTEKFSDQISERIISLADLYSFGYETFGAQENFNRWMFTSNQALGGLKPFDIVDNIYGREEIRKLIGRIAYGVYS